jgi:hypothetical protein
MIEYRFLCPQCGQAFAEGTSFRKCPRCLIPLREAGPQRVINAGELPEEVDLDELLRNVLAEQRPGEDIDRALSRVIGGEYPDAASSMLKLLKTQLDQWENFRGITRQEAAEELSRSQSSMALGDDGRQEVRTELRSETRIEGLDHMDPEARAEALRQIQDLLADGGSTRRVVIDTRIGSKRIGCGTPVIVVAIGMMLGALAIWT